jgi:hypothetical protein
MEADWLALRPGRFTHEAKAPNNHQVRDLNAGMVAVEERNIPFPAGNRIWIPWP